MDPLTVLSTLAGYGSLQYDRRSYLLQKASEAARTDDHAELISEVRRLSDLAEGIHLMLRDRPDQLPYLLERAAVEATKIDIWVADEHHDAGHELKFTFGVHNQTNHTYRNIVAVVEYVDPVSSVCRWRRQVAAIQRVESLQFLPFSFACRSSEVESNGALFLSMRYTDPYLFRWERYQGKEPRFVMPELTAPGLPTRSGMNIEGSAVHGGATHPANAVALYGHTFDSEDTIELGVPIPPKPWTIKRCAAWLRPRRE